MVQYDSIPFNPPFSYQNHHVSLVVMDKKTIFSRFSPQDVDVIH